MVIALLLFVILGVIVTLLPGALLGYGCVAASGSMSLGARIALVLFTAGASAATWLMLVGISHMWRPAAAILSFTATAASGALFLTIDAYKRRAPRPPHPAWQVRS
ncbi:hypothetical protein OG373_15560 [Streptomyces avidinii]|uniref:hypothetical protein n=1 Tax=Streptomyces avidinii TaxID=1895 RepID=UPI003869A81F|nr:hypothetical protein OG373_15560 [Streptomyces avidinii]